MFMFVRGDQFSPDRPMALASQLGQLVRRANHHSMKLEYFCHSVSITMSR